MAESSFSLIIGELIQIFSVEYLDQLIFELENLLEGLFLLLAIVSAFLSFVLFCFFVLSFVTKKIEKTKSFGEKPLKLFKNLVIYESLLAAYFFILIVIFKSLNLKLFNFFSLRNEKLFLHVFCLIFVSIGLSTMFFFENKKEIVFDLFSTNLLLVLFNLILFFAFFKRIENQNFSRVKDYFIKIILSVFLINSFVSRSKKICKVILNTVSKEKVHENN